MEFKKFLLENTSDGNYKIDIDEEEALRLIKTHCSKVDVEAPFWRGMSKQYNNFYILDAESQQHLKIQVTIITQY